TLVVDKTGTLTEGKPALSAVRTVGSVDEPTLLRLAAGLELGSEHPLAAAIVRGAEARSLTPAPASGFNSITGKGVTGSVEGRQVALGNTALLRELGVDAGDAVEIAEAMRTDGQTALFVAIDGKVAGVLGVA